MACAVRAECRYGSHVAQSFLGEKWIPCAPKNVASARRFVRDVAADWLVDGDVREIAELLTSELVTNALSHGSSGVSARNAIRVTVSREKELMIVDVHDSCIAIPRMRRADYLGVTGRGLPIVQNLSHNWGWTLNPAGKSVWFQLLAWP